MAIVSVLLAAVFVGMLAMIVSTRVTNMLHLSKRSGVVGQTGLTAFAGLSKALEELRADPTWTGVSKHAPPGIPGTVSVYVFDNTGSGVDAKSPDGIAIPAGTFLVKAVGDEGEPTESIMYGILTGSAGGRFTRAITTDDYLGVEGGTVDAYDSSLANAGTVSRVVGAAKVGTQTMVDVKAANTIAGAIDGKVENHQAMAAGLVVDALSTVGSYNQLSSAINPNRNIPASSFLGGAWLAPSTGDTIVLTPGHHKALRADGDAVVKITASGDYYFKQGFEFWDKSSLEISPGVKARIFTEGPALAYGEAKLNFAGTPDQLELLSYSDDSGSYLNLSGTPESHNFRIGADSHVVATVAGDGLMAKVNGNLWGAFNGLSMWVYNYGTEGTAAVHYDINLANGSAGVTGSYLSTWKAH
jgi:hypothetical protein